MPTVAADSIDYVLPTKESFQGAPQFHEDEWAQLEFFPKARLGEIQKMLKEYKSFEAKNASNMDGKTVIPVAFLAVLFYPVACPRKILPA